MLLRKKNSGPDWPGLGAGRGRESFMMATVLQQPRRKRGQVCPLQSQLGSSLHIPFTAPHCAKNKARQYWFASCFLTSRPMEPTVLVNCVLL